MFSEPDPRDQRVGIAYESDWFFAVFSGIEFMIWLSVKSLEEGNHEQGPWVTGTAEASQFAKAEEEPVFALGFDASTRQARARARGRDLGTPPKIAVTR